MDIPPLDPQVQADLWQFIADVQAGSAEPSPGDHEFACFLVGLWETTMALYLARVKDISRDEAAVAVAELVEAQRLLYASLAATPTDSPA